MQTIADFYEGDFEVEIFEKFNRKQKKYGFGRHKMVQNKHGFKNPLVTQKQQEKMARQRK